jgi:adenosylmethionine-8-amino-7-oxononanoate aminotransferase
MPASAPAVAVSSASGTKLHLADGRHVVDGMSSWWSAIHGYAHPVLDAAVRSQIDDMAHVMFGGLTHGPAVELAERLVEITPSGLNHVFFADSGSVSVEVAIKMALQYWQGRGRPQRNRLLTVRRGYHGDTLAAMSVCDPDTGMHSLFRGVVPQQLFAPAPTPVFGAPFGPDHLATVAALLAEHTDDVAAVILEPVVQGAGGMRFYAPEYVAELRRLCDDHGVLLIADEIATGFGRTGPLFACDHAGVAPDILCLGKALTGGYLTLAATLTTTAVAEGVSACGALMHGPTFMANPLAASVALASVDLLLGDPDRRANIDRIQQRLVTGLDSLRHRPGVADVRVLGAIGVVELDEPIDMAASQAELLDAGVWLRPFGRLLYTMPPFISSDSDLVAITDAIDRVVAAVVEPMAGWA